jgi:hypothetical protein
LIVYNVTTKVAPGIAAAWLDWLKEEHIPDLVQTGCFTHAVILHIKDLDGADGPTYAVQYYAESMAQYNNYIEEYSATLREKVISKWGDQFISFRTVMEIVN